MSGGLATYPDYKYSDSEFMGEVPKHWDVVRMSKLASKITNGYVGPTRGLFVDEGVKYLQSLHIKGNKIIFTPTYFVTKEWSNSKEKSVLREGDVLIVQTGDVGQAACVTAEFEGANCHALIVVATNEGKILGKFLSWCLNGDYGQRTLKSIQTGALHPHLNCGIVKYVHLPVPPIQEQQKILSFLDYETAKIDALIEKQQQLIALLGEKRQAVISHAVTKGLNPDVPMRDSGIEWLGEVPEHWEVKPFRHVFEISGGQVDPRAPRYNQMPLVAPNHIESGTGRLKSIESAQEQGAISGKYLVDENDIIYSKIRPSLRKVTLAPTKCLCSADMYALKPKDGGVSEYYARVLLSEYFSEIVVLEAMRVAMPKANRESLAPIPITTPPLSEQGDIADFIAKQSARFDSLELRATSAVDLLQERRTALISAAVTGKIDVRNWKPPTDDKPQKPNKEAA